MSATHVGARFIAPGFPTRKNIRLKDHRYSDAGVYFVTVCTIERRCILGTVSAHEFTPNDRGLLVERQWRDIASRFPSVKVDGFVVMPNHLHGLLVFEEPGAINRAPTLGEVVRTFKALVSRTAMTPLWQRGFFERVVRNDNELSRIREYIANNATLWSLDRENPDCEGFSK